jgi:hypothetical protein
LTINAPYHDAGCFGVADFRVLGDTELGQMIYDLNDASTYRTWQLSASVQLFTRKNELSKGKNFRSF